MKDGKVLRSVGVVGGFTLLSRSLGMLRDIIIAFFFGTSLQASAFFVAFTIPNLFRRLFGEGALSAAFIPVFMETRTREGDKAAWDMGAKVVTMTSAILSAIAIIGVLLFSVGLRIPSVSARWLVTFELARIMFPYVVLICIAALCMAVLNSFKHFSTPAFAPSLLNLILIILMLGIFPFMEAESPGRAKVLSWGVLLAGVAQLGIQLPALKRFGCPFRFSTQWNDPRVRKMLLLMGPAALGMAVTQFNVLLDRLLAMWIGPWAPAALFYSERMVYFPLGIIATAMGTVLLPTFSSHAAMDDHESMADTITHSLRQLAFIMAPAAMGLLVLSPNILSAIFEWNGSFDAQSTLLSSRALMFYAPGLVVFSASKVFVPAFYAMQDTKTPVRIGIYVVLLNLLMNIAFILILPEFWKHAGMALSTVLAELFGMATLGGILSRRVNNIQWRTVANAFVRYTACAAIMAAGAWLVANHSFALLDLSLSAKFAQIGSVAMGVSSGIAVYLFLAAGLKSPELSEIKSALLGK